MELVILQRNVPTRVEKAMALAPMATECAAFVIIFKKSIKFSDLQSKSPFQSAWDVVQPLQRTQPTSNKLQSP